MKTRFAASALACLVAGTAWGQSVSTLDAGQYSHHKIAGPYCGLMTDRYEVIGWFDTPEDFNREDHYKADFLWFTQGTMQWDFPLEPLPADAIVQSVSFTAEISAEYPSGRSPWPSPVAFSLGGVEVGTWTVPGDPNYFTNGGYGRQENHFGPWDSQYGWLVTISVERDGTWLDYGFRTGDASDIWLSEVTVDKIAIEKSFPVAVDVLTGNGINIYGNTWGDYDEDLTVEVHYRSLTEECGEPQNHGQYQTCVVHYAQDLRDQGLIDQDAYTALVTTSAQSDIGKK